MAPPRKQRRLTPASNAAASTTTVSWDGFLMSALAVPDASTSIGLSLERILGSSPLLSDKESQIESVTRLASALMDAAMRSARRLAAAHNMCVWPLPAEVTTKVFSMLDTKSVCCAAATCLLFNKCASDPLCYSNIQLTRSMKKLSDKVVSTMIKRAGKNLQSIKLGRLQSIHGVPKPPLTGSCLSALLLDNVSLHLRSLHLYNLKFMVTNYNFRKALSACRSLVELEFVGMGAGSVSILKTICNCCHSIERLCIDNCNIDGDACELENLIKKFRRLSSLSLRRSEIKEDALSALKKGACRVKRLDLSHSSNLLGNFLRDLGKGGAADSLETLILRDSENLEAKEVSDFLSAVLYGGWKTLRYVDISNCFGLVHGPSIPRTRCAIDVSRILQERPDVHFIADFPPYLKLFRFFSLYLPTPVPSLTHSCKSHMICKFFFSDSSVTIVVLRAHQCSSNATSSSALSSAYNSDASTSIC